MVAAPDPVGDLTEQFRSAAIGDDIGSHVAGPSNPSVYVDPYVKKGKHVYFMYNGVEYKSSRKEWEWYDSTDESGNAVFCCDYRRDGVRFWSYMLPSAEPDEEYAGPGEEGKGKGKGKAERGKKGKGKGK